MRKAQTWLMLGTALDLKKALVGGDPSPAQILFEAHRSTTQNNSRGISMISRLLGCLCLISAIALAIYAGKDLLQKDEWTVANPAKRISMIIDKDINELRKQRELPAEWAKIAKATYKFESSLVKVLMADTRPHLSFTKNHRKPASEEMKMTAPKPEMATTPPNSTAQTKVIEVAKSKANPGTAEYELEIDILDVPDESNPGFILQMSLIETATKNKVHELGRTYHWSSLNGRHP